MTRAAASDRSPGHAREAVFARPFMRPSWADRASWIFVTNVVHLFLHAVIKHESLLARGRLRAACRHLVPWRETARPGLSGATRRLLPCPSKACRPLSRGERGKQSGRSSNAENSAVARLHGGQAGNSEGNVPPPCHIIVTSHRHGHRKRPDRPGRDRPERAAPIALSGSTRCGRTYRACFLPLRVWPGSVVAFMMMFAIRHRPGPLGPDSATVRMTVPGRRRVFADNARAARGEACARQVPGDIVDDVAGDVVGDWARPLWHDPSMRHGDVALACASNGRAFPYVSVPALRARSDAEGAVS